MPATKKWTRVALQTEKERMKTCLSRRQFLAASAGSAALALSPIQAATPSGTAPGTAARLPSGRIGNLTVSRLISGGNLISGWAHARDLHYVASLMRAYNTPEKVLETLQLLEEHGVNTIIADPRKKPMDLFRRYWSERGGRIQWIAEGHPELDDWRTNLQASIDFGAAAVYIQGVKADQFRKLGRLDVVGECVEFIRRQGVPAGIGAHKIEVIADSERNGYHADFYVKTLHHHRYGSAPRPGQTPDVIDNPYDNYWDLDPEQTIRVMQDVEKPWIAFKVLAAGAIRPESGFRYAFENGADFICAGMFDFQVAEDVKLVQEILPSSRSRERGWFG